MRRFASNKLAAPVAVATCALVFAASFFSLVGTEHYLARLSLADEADQMLTMADGLNQSAHDALLTLPPFDRLTCEHGESEMLWERAVRNPYVQWYAVARDGKILCASNDRLRSWPDSYIHHETSGWSLQLVKVTSGRNALAVIQTRGDMDYVALLDPMLFEFVSNAKCTGCVSYEITVHGGTDLTVTSSDPVKHPVLQYLVDQQLTDSKVTLRLLATQTYVDRFRLQGTIAAVGGAAIVALALSFLIYYVMIRRTSIRSLIERGLRKGQFLPYYQPIIDARDGSILGAEALARWQLKGELIPPSQFVDYAEESGLIRQITNQLIDKLFQDLKALGWVGSHRYISINVMPDQITESRFCEQLLAALSEHGIPGRNIAVEITERRKLHNLAEGRRRLEQLEASGIRVEIDDAGTGFGGFAYVQELPVGTIKIDKMFVDTLRTREDAKHQVLEAIVSFAQKSGLETIAEGVETTEQVDDLLRMGVHAIQGYVYARPMPAADLIKWIAAGGIQVPAGHA